jgi:hypothetical protein
MAHPHPRSPASSHIAGARTAVTCFRPRLPPESEFATHTLKAGRAPKKIELSYMGQAKVHSLEALTESGIARVVIPLPASDSEGITRGLEKIANEVVDRL